MAASPSHLRRALAAVTVTALAATGALVATSAAQALPDAPIIFGPLDSTINTLSVSVDPAPSTLEQTVAVSWEFQETGAVGIGCEVVVPADTPDGTTFPCDVTVPNGQYGFYDLVAVSTDVDGGSPPSNTISSVRYGEAASPSRLELGAPLNVPDFPIRIGTLEPAISGTAPALGTVELLGYRSDLGVGTESSLCLVGVPTSGAFSCAATFPSYGIWEVRVVAQDVEGGFAVEPEAVESTLRVEVFPPVPTVSILPAPGEIGIEATGVADSDVGTLLALNYVIGESGVVQGGCPAGYDGTFEPTGGDSVTCAFTVSPGVHVARSEQFVNAASSIVREEAIYVPAAPTLAVEPVPGGAAFSGTIDALSDDLTASGTDLDGIVVTVRDAASNVACTAVADLGTGTWSCDDEMAAGTQLFTAVASSLGFADDPNAVGSFIGYSNGLSDASPSVSATIPAAVTPSAPTMAYGFGPASIRADAVGLPDAAVGIELYSITEPDGPGGGYQYGLPVRSCGFIPGEGNEGSIVTSPSVISDCLFDGLAPGIWNVYSSQRYYFEQSDYVDDYIRIPSAPTLTASRNDAEQIVASGQGTPGFRVLVRQLGGSGACDAVVGTNGAWSCVVPGIAGDALLRAQQQSQGFVADPNGESPFSSFDGYSAFTPTAFVAAVPPAQPVVSPQPLPWVLEGYNGEPLFPGQTLALSAQGLPVGTEIVIEIRSTPQVLGSSIADDLGRFALDVTVPLDLEPGDHTLVGLATPPGGVVSPIEIPVVVVAAPVDDAGSEQPAPVAEGSSGGSGDRDVAIDRADPAAPSAISDSIPTIDRIFRTPLIAVTASGLALAILLLVALPAELLNSTVASNSRRLGRWYAAIDERIQRATEWFAAITRTRALAAALLVVATAVIFGFVDPDYGFDPVSLRMTVSLAIGLFVVTYVSAWISGAIIQRVWSIPTRVGLQPAALLFAVVGVIIARLLEFSPGFLIGLVIGLDLLTRVDATFRVRATLTSLGVTVGLALLGWVGFSILSAVSTGEPTVAELLLSDALVATAAEGMTAALASLLPLGFLQGHEIFRRSKGLWAGTFLVVATLFALIVLPTASETEGEVADVGFWMLVMVIFAVVTLTLWAVLQFTGRGDDDADEVVEQPAAAAR